MKSIVAVTVALIQAMLAVPAVADDRPAIWSGLYVGAHVGGSHISMDREVSAFGASQTESANGSGAVYGIYAGANAQSGRWVYGIEGDTNLNCRDHACLYSLRGRLGYTFGNVLLYGTAGGAVRQESLTWVNGTTGGRVKQSDTVAGFIGGLGVELQFAKNWALRGEALFAPLADASFTSPGAGSTMVKQSEDWFIGRVGVSYHFN